MPECKMMGELSVGMVGPLIFMLWRTIRHSACVVLCTEDDGMEHTVGNTQHLVKRLLSYDIILPGASSVLRRYFGGT